MPLELRAADTLAWPTSLPAEAAVDSNVDEGVDPKTEDVCIMELAAGSAGDILEQECFAPWITDSEAHRAYFDFLSDKDDADLF